MDELRARQAVEEAEEAAARERELREGLERDYANLDAHCEMLENQVSDLRELAERQRAHDAAFTGIVVAILLLLLLFAASACKRADAGESPAASVPPVVVDASDQRAQEHRSHEVEAVEAGKLDSDGNPIDGEKRIVTAIRELVQRRQDEAAAGGESEAEEATVYYEEEYDYQPVYYGGYSGSTATSLSDLLNGQGRAHDGNGTSYTWFYHDIGNGALDIPGETFDSDGVSHDGDGYIVVAADGYAYGEVIDTPYGEAKVYDKGSGYGNIDIYTNR